jgi:hypothetical protein
MCSRARLWNCSMLGTESMDHTIHFWFHKFWAGIGTREVIIPNEESLKGDLVSAVNVREVLLFSSTGLCGMRIFHEWWCHKMIKPSSHPHNRRSNLLSTIALCWKSEPLTGIFRKGPHESLNCFPEVRSGIYGPISQPLYLEKKSFIQLMDYNISLPRMYCTCLKSNLMWGTRLRKNRFRMC